MSSLITTLGGACGCNGASLRSRMKGTSVAEAGRYTASSTRFVLGLVRYAASPVASNAKPNSASVTRNVLVAARMVEGGNVKFTYQSVKVAILLHVEAKRL